MRSSLRKNNFKFVSFLALELLKNDLGGKQNKNQMASARLVAKVHFLASLLAQHLHSTSSFHCMENSNGLRFMIQMPENNTVTRCKSDVRGTK